ncbi:hypothetical protein ACWERI_35440 [Streptomyces collinus]
MTVLGFPLAVAGAVGMVAGIRKPREGAEAGLAREQAATLARLVAEGEGRVLTQLLGKDTARINLRYDLMASPERAASAPAAGLTVTDPGADLPDIAAYYRATRPARLVVTGAPGSGKTVLALQLLLGLVASRGEDDPVPVRVPLAEWDIVVPLRLILVQRLISTYHLTKTIASNLVAHGLVLPVLDGLDEMDPTLPNGDPDPAAPRARAALDQLSSYQDAGVAAPLVLVCRSAHYDALATTDLLLDAARIVVAPVASSPAVTYLTARARDVSRWQPLLHHLTSHPASAHAALLSTPWRLCLTATVYHRTGDPAELLTHPDPADLDDHLLARYINAATLAAADTNPHGYTPRQIHHWLHQLAVGLASDPSLPPRTDIGLDHLWPLAEPIRFVKFSAVLTTLTLLFFLVPIAWATTRPAVYLTVGAVALLVGLASVEAIQETPAVRLDLRQLATPDGRSQLARGLKIGFSIGLMLGLMLGLGLGLSMDFGLVGGLVRGLAIAPVFGLTCGVIFGVSADQSSAVKPGTIIGEDVRLGIVLGVMWGLLGGLTAGLLFGPALGLVSGLAFGLVFGRTVSDTSFRYLVFLLCQQGRVPFRLAKFLDWGCGVGLMRYSGPAYQFRHRELQLWLNAHPDPVA